jgi:phosphate:Na+ symporter
VFNVVGTILFTIAMEILKALGFMPDFWSKVVNSGDIANFQTVFNLITAVVLIPFTGLLVKLTYVLVKPDKETEQTDDYAAFHSLDEKLYVVPQIAISEATAAIGVMGKIAHQNFRDSITQLDAYSEEVSVGIGIREEKLDEFTDTVENFLVGLAKTVQSDEQSEDINILVQTTTDFERIGDYADNINEFAERIKKEQVTFSEMALEELAILFSAVSDIIDLAVAAFVDNDDEKARQVEPLEEVIDDMVQYLRDSHIDRLKSGECTISAGIVYLETLTYLERASDQCSSVAVLQLSKNNPKIRENHHDYIRELHKEVDETYVSALRARREQYLKPMYEIKGK